jgi:hypothetical protein
MTAERIPVETSGQARLRLIAAAVLERKRLFAMVEIANEQGEIEMRDRLFAQWQELTKRIEALNR